MSVDGYIDDAGPGRLVLSNAADLARVDQLRASCDAILVGSGTVRRDNPRLLVRSGTARPAKVTITSCGDLDPSARFFTEGDVAKLVYCESPAAPALRERIGSLASVVDAGSPVRLGHVLSDLAGRGVRRLLVEGGTRIHTQFLEGGLVDELQLVVAPFFVGDGKAPRFVGDASFPHDAAHPMRLAEARNIGEVVLLRYRLGDR